MGGSLDLADQPIKSELVSSLFSKSDKKKSPNALWHSHVHTHACVHIHRNAHVHTDIF